MVQVWYDTHFYKNFKCSSGHQLDQGALRQRGLEFQFPRGCLDDGLIKSSDGKLSRNEANAFLLNEIFTSRDANHDGRLTPEKWGPKEDAARTKQFKMRDGNDDGIVTKDEATKYGRAHGVANKILREADKNQDGALDRGEVQAYYTSREGLPR